jgi:hypothetical protein
MRGIHLFETKNQFTRRGRKSTILSTKQTDISVCACVNGCGRSGNISEEEFNRTLLVSICKKRRVKEHRAFRHRTGQNVEQSAVLFLKPKLSHYTPWRRLVGDEVHSFYSVLTSALDGGEWSASRPDRAYPPERTPGPHLIWGWVGLRAVLDTEGRINILCVCWESNPDSPVIQSVVRHYTAWATRIFILETVGILQSRHLFNCPAVSVHWQWYYRALSSPRSKGTTAHTLQITEWPSGNTTGVQGLINNVRS